MSLFYFIFQYQIVILECIMVLYGAYEDYKKFYISHIFYQNVEKKMKGCKIFMFDESRENRKRKKPLYAFQLMIEKQFFLRHF